MRVPVCGGLGVECEPVAKRVSLVTLPGVHKGCAAGELSEYFYVDIVGTGVHPVVDSEVSCRSERCPLLPYGGGAGRIVVVSVIPQPCRWLREV